MLLSPIHCCGVTKPPYLLCGELCTSPLHSNRLYVYTVCCRRGGQCFSVLRTSHTDVVGDSSGRSYVTEQGLNVPLLRTRGLLHIKSVDYMLFLFDSLIYILSPLWVFLTFLLIISHSFISFFFSASWSMLLLDALVFILLHSNPPSAHSSQKVHRFCF